MATSRSFQEMLNEYLPNKLLKEDLVRRDWVLSNIEHDEGWLTGSGIANTGLIVPFRAAGASSVKYGGLTATGSVKEDVNVRGYINAPKEIWGTMKFKHRDLMEHNKVSEQNFLRLLPDSVEDFMARFKNVVSTNLLNGAHFATLVADGTATTVTVDRPDRFDIGMLFGVKDNDSAIVTPLTVTGIVMDTGVITFTGGSAAAMTVAQSAKCYNIGADTDAFNSLRQSLLSAANGGDATLHGQTKATYPFLQAINVNGGASGTNPLAINASNIMEKIFEALVTVRQLGKGNPTKIVMSYKNLGSCMKVIEGQKGSFNVIANEKPQKAIQYGWMEIVVMNVTGQVLSLVGVQECDDDVIYILDMKALKFYSNGGIQKRQNPDGREYFEERDATNGYAYYLDICLFGELAVQRPSTCGIIYGISY